MMIDAKTFPDIDPQDFTVRPIEQAETIPSRWYTDQRFLELEKKAIFEDSWQYVGHTSKLGAAGSQIVGTVADNPVLVVRGNDSRLRAFYNVCRHRGGPLALEDCTSKVLQCKYHGWTYLLDGSLRGTPKFDRTELFDKKDYGLVPVEVETWQDLVFVHLSEHRHPLEKTLDGIARRISPMKIGGKKFHSRVVYDVRCNWKVYVDNYLEGYHLPYVHPELTTMLDYQNYVTETFGQYSLQFSRIAKSGGVYDSGSAFYYFVFPNFMLNILPGRLQTNLVHPVSSDRCRVIFDYLYDDTESAAGRKRIEDDLSYSDRVQQEDIEICERVQQGLSSRAYDKGRFSPEMEAGVYHFQSLLKNVFKKALRI
ncbi:MAG TPA: aromatic ring-hydroxylating dioxygenase subunit alpha [Bacteroidota bacterium]|nr:aromatic ring-hydroxylating dioxygenase subunit alpha [Bacteroidota bacterium]